ncbi:MOG interacting and ectopic P-granules protein 1-like 1, partial [Homarus americanus]
EPIKTFLRRINKDLEEFEKKEKEEEEKKKAEEKRLQEEKEKEEKEKKKKEEAEERKRKREAGEEVSESEDEEKKEEEEKEEKMETEKEKKDDKKVKESEENNESKEEKGKETDKGGKKDDKGTVVDDDDKENKGKVGGTDSVVDVEKDNKKKKEEDMTHLGKWEPYYRSALGKFMLDLGLNQAQEFLQCDLLRMQKRKLDKMKTTPSREGILSVRMLEKQLEFTRIKNSHLSVPLKICKFCNFKTESELVMDRHLESPHMVILFHMEAEHNIRGRLERAPAFFQCSLCPYEDNNKSKMTRHSFSCSKKYKPEKNCELIDWEPPAKIPKIHRGRPNTLGKAFEPVKMPNLLPKSLAGMNISIQSAVASNLLTTANAASIAAGRGRGRPVGSYKNVGTIANQVRGTNTGNTGSLLYTTRGTTTTTTGNLVQQVSGNAQQFTLGNQMFHLVNGHLVPMSGAAGSVSSVSVSSQSAARVPRILPSSSSSSVSLIPGLGASSSITIQDLEQLRNHMNLIHKVKIHPKMIYNRPPLNCQKCQHRFFTDQGLERHLLGTHGLVTSSMQEAANKGKDAGRCPICGKVFQWKLLNHVSRDHKMTLKPAHLSYKCTVCTATFNMYRLFENHVYSAHSVVNKNKGDSGKKQGSGGSGSSDSPLKINDEITIIPQPAVKSQKSDKSISSGKKSDGTPTVSKEITITKVGSRPTRRSGSSVEVISLDESPTKKAGSDSKKRSNKDNVGNGSKKARTSS